MICFHLFIYFISTKSKNQMATPLLSPGHALFWRCPPTESLKRPYFPLPLSILAGTNLNMLLLFFFLQPPFDSIENPSPIRFPGKFIIVWFPRKSMQNPQGKPKKLLFFVAPCVFWICFRVLFAVVPLDLNFTNPKSTFFEPGWKTQALPANHDQILYPVRGLDW